MAESETKETPINKVISNVLKAAREQSKKPTPQEVAEVMHRIYPEKNGPPNPKKDRTGRVIEGAKHVVAEAKMKGVHVSEGLHEWTSKNKLPVLDKDPAQAFRIAQADLSVAIRASNLPEDHWIVQAASRVKNAESAEALAIMALAPEEIRENPNFIFQTAAQLAGSDFGPDTQTTTKAFIAELQNLQGVDGFNMTERQLDQALVPPPPPEEFLGQDISTLPDPVKHVFMAMNEDLAGAGYARLDEVSGEERDQIASRVYRVMQSYNALIGNIDTAAFDKDKFQIFAQLSLLKDNLSYRVSPERGIDADTIAQWAGVSPESLRHKPPLQTRFSREKVKDILRPSHGEEASGADKYYEELSDRIFTSGKEAHQADLTDQYEYSDFETILRYAFGEETTMTTKFRERWNYDYPRNAVITRILGGYGGEKELIQLSGSIPSDTLNYETNIRFAPEVIAQAELILPKLAAEDRYTYDNSVRYVTDTYVRDDKDPDRKKLGKYIIEKGKRLNRAEVWKKYETTRSKYFPGENYINMEKAMRAGHGSMVHDRWIVANMPEQINLASITRSLEAEITARITPDMNAAEKQAVVDAVVSPYTERLEFLWNKVTLKGVAPEQLYNPEYLKKIRGFSPYEIMLFDWLEKTKPDAELFELRKAILAQRRFMVGSRRIFSLVGTLSNMPGLEFEPGGADVMVESLEYTMRAEQAERFVFARFGMGKEDVGKRIMAAEQEELCRLRGVTIDDAAELKRAIKDDESIPMRRYRTVATKTKEAYGVGYTQLAIGTLLDSTCPFDYSTWRPEEAIIKVLNETRGTDAENMALCIRLRMTGVGEGNSEKRAPLVDKIMKREPSVLLLRLGGEAFDDQVLRGNHIEPGTGAWDQFLTVLGHAERRVFTESEFYHDPNVDLGLQAYFDRVFSPEVFTMSGIEESQIADLKRQYFQIIQDTQNVFKTKQTNQSTSSSDMWKKYGMPMTLSLTDVNLADADFERLPQSSQFRQDVGDTSSRLEARNDLIAMIKDPSITMPEDPQKALIPALQKFGDDVIGYKDAGFTEERVSVMLDSILSHNAAKDFYRGLVQVVPFLPNLLRGIAGQDARKWYIRSLLWPVKELAIGYTFLPVLSNLRGKKMTEWPKAFVRSFVGRPDLRDLLRKNPKEWPKIFGQEFISGAVAVKGSHGNALEALGMAKVLQDVEHAGIFTHHEHLQDLRDKYKTRALSRLFELKKFWWVPFAAAIAVGLAIAIKEQGLDEDGHK